MHRGMVALTVALAAAGCAGPRSHYTPRIPGIVSVVNTNWNGPAYRKDGEFFGPNELPRALGDQPAAAARARRAQRWTRGGILTWLPATVCVGATFVYQLDELARDQRLALEEPSTWLMVGCAIVGYAGIWMLKEGETDRWDAIAMYNDAVLAGRLPAVAPPPALAPPPAAPPAPAP